LKNKTAKQLIQKTAPARAQQTKKRKNRSKQKYQDN